MGRAHWSSRLVFILAAAGSAAGLGNIWKFPYIAGTNGGGAFVLLYLAFIVAIGVPIFIAECYIGQTSQRNIVNSFGTLVGRKTAWRFVGWMGLLAGFFILCFYHVVGGWVLDFEFHSLLNHFGSKSDEEIKGTLGELFNGPGRQIILHFIFTCLTCGIVIGGVKGGIEKWNKILMPTLIVLLLGLFIRSWFLPGFSEAFSFMFSPDTSKLSEAGVLEAIGHTFFTLSLGMGSIITYGSYLEKETNIVSSAMWVAFLDTIIAIVAGLTIFSVVYSFPGLEPGAGPTLLFSTLPMLFTKLPGGYFISVAFFLLVVFAALTSAISILEVIVAYWVENHDTNRTVTTAVIGAMIFVLGIPCVLSFNLMADVKVFGLTYFDVLDKLTSSVMLPLGGILISLFYGWVLGPKAVQATVAKSHASHLLAVGLLWATRIIAPIGVLLIFINTLIGIV